MMKSQTTLEMTLAFLVMLSLFFGTMGIWAWGDRQIAERQTPYNDQRVDSGTPERSSDSTANKQMQELKQRTELSENEVHYPLAEGINLE